MSKKFTPVGDSGFCDWIEQDVGGISSELLTEICRGQHIEVHEGLNIAGRKEIYRIHNGLLSSLFPGVWSRENLEEGDLLFFLTGTLREVSHGLLHSIRDILRYHCHLADCTGCDCSQRASDLCRRFISRLPQIKQLLITDIDAAYDGDPAAHSKDEILLSYPCIEAIATHRLAHELYILDVPIIPRIMSERAHNNTGIDIHPGATIKEGFFIDHGTGVVIGETCSIGKNVKLYQGVTLGATSPFDKEGSPKRGVKRHPDVEDNVIIYANAVILGGGTVIGKNCVIGGNSWVTSSVPPNTMVYSNSSTDMKRMK
jgi:serine O-acetyltransferase